ncbi:STAS domain-containing protein [Gracilibacillus massiliensis]|uniref:hypothetical protein n=1 Tax=Gracilibacillus massiliensis TaxID=1564956 RepID=UPI00071D0C5C|nr:hypothetical protein [Gracilibacillus massiliensis]
MEQAKHLPVVYFKVDQNFKILETSDQAKQEFIRSSDFFSLLDSESREKALSFLQDPLNSSSIELNMKSISNPLSVYQVSINWDDQIGHIVCYPANDQVEQLAIQLTSLRERLDDTNFSLLTKKEELERAQQRIDALSGPLIFLSSELVLIPLFGDVTIDKMQIINEKVSRELYQSDSTKLLIDFTAVDHLHPKGIDLLGELIEIIFLLGQKPIITGLSPSHARLLSNIVSFKQIKKINNVQTAIKQML